MHTIRQPVTLGSSVPLCPVFSTRRILRIHATTSWDDGLAGLSRLMKPDLMGRGEGVIKEHATGITALPAMSVPDVVCDVPLQGVAAVGQGGVVACPHIQLIEVLR